MLGGELVMRGAGKLQYLHSKDVKLWSVPCESKEHNSMLPSWGVGKSIGSQHLNSICRHIICSSNTQIKLAEHDVRLQPRRKPCKTKTIISTMVANALQQGIQSNSLHLLVQQLQVP